MCIRYIQVWSLSAQRHNVFSQLGQRTLTETLGELPCGIEAGMCLLGTVT